MANEPEPLQPPPGGYLHVGLDPNNEITINLPEGTVGHIVFNSQQARHLAKLLVKLADESDHNTLESILIIAP